MASSDFKKYDENNIFAKILKKEIPSNILLENDYFIAINDINPQAKIHILIISKNKHVNFIDFSEKNSNITENSIKEMAGFVDIINKIKTLKKLEDGFKIVINNGKKGGQEIAHFHTHILCD